MRELPAGFALDTAQSTRQNFSIADVGAAVSGDAFNAPNFPIKYIAKPGQVFGEQATANAQPFQNIVAHHTGGPTLQSAVGNPFGAGPKFGYHFYIEKDGTIAQGAPLDARTNHVQPPSSSQRTDRPDISNNNSIGVSFVGSGEAPTPAQFAAAENLSRALMERYGITPQNVVGHGEIQGNSRQPGEGMPLVNALRNTQPTQVASAPAVQQAEPPRPPVDVPPQQPPQRSVLSSLFSHQGAVAAEPPRQNLMIQPDGAGLPAPPLTSDLVRAHAATQAPQPSGDLPPGFVLDSSGGIPAGFERDARFAERFGAMQPPANAKQLEDELQRAARLERGEPSNKYSYGAVYPQMVRESVDVMSSGVQQARDGKDWIDKAKGAGTAALGAVGYVGSPLNAAYRTLVGNPVEQLTGIPRDYTEFAASLATPGIGLPGLTRALPKTAAVAPTVAELKDSYKAAKNSPEVNAVVINPAAAAKFATKTDAELQKEWFRPNSQPKTFAILDELQNPPVGSTLTMADVDAARRRLGDLAGKFGSEESAAASIAKSKLDRWLDDLPQSDVIAGDAAAAQKIMKDARGDYSAAKLGEALDKRLAKGELNTAAANSGMNLQNQLRQQAKSFLASPDSRSLTVTERKTLEKFVKGTTTQNIVRAASNILGGGGGLGTAVVGLGGLATAGAAGAALPLVGYALKAIGNSLTARQANKLSNLLRSRSPLAKQQQAALEHWAKYVKEAESGPMTPRVIAMLTIQSRNLANNLKDAGISVKPEELMRSITAHPGTRADENNQ